MKVLLSLSLLTLGLWAAQEQEAPGGKLEQHAWLQRFAGKWNVSSQMLQPGSDPVTWESEETVRKLGELWITSETTAYGFTSIQTLGYDPQKKAFVGSYVDTMQTTMWLFTGKLDEDRTVLTLESEGPSMSDPNETGKYRELHERVTDDHKRVTHQTLGEDGSWTTYMIVDSHRSK